MAIPCTVSETYLGTLGIKPAYAVVVPVRVSDPYLHLALDSISMQMVRPASTYVVINGSDGSRCQSLEVCEQFDFVTPVLIQPLGMVPAIVHGINLVQDPVIMFLDSDDLWSSDKASRQLSVLHEQPHIDTVSSQTQNFRQYPDGTLDYLARETAGLLGATAFRTDVFTRFGGIDPEASHFTFLYRWWNRARNAGIVEAKIDEVGLLRRVHAENGWVSQSEQGKTELMAELRRLSRDKIANRSQR